VRVHERQSGSLDSGLGASSACLESQLNKGPRTRWVHMEINYCLRRTYASGEVNGVEMLV
jgi:hypothetical protein